MTDGRRGANISGHSNGLNVSGRSSRQPPISSTSRFLWLDMKANNGTTRTTQNKWSWYSPENPSAIGERRIRLFFFSKVHGCTPGSIFEHSEALYPAPMGIGILTLIFFSFSFFPFLFFSYLFLFPSVLQIQIVFLINYRHSIRAQS